MTLMLFNKHTTMNTEKKYKILVAEDNHINIQVAKYMLAKVSTVLDFVMDGQSAVDQFINNSYDIILMDMKMPVLDGIEATKAIRDIEATSNSKTRIPIIAMTANSACEKAADCEKAGMDGFLSKPFNTDDLLRVIKTIEQDRLQQ